MAKKSSKKSKSTRKGARKAAPKKAKVAAAPRKTMPGYISHVELVSNDPAATRGWAEAAFGWTFEVLPAEHGDYHMWTHKKTWTGGGIRSPAPEESAAAVPYVEVPAMQAGFDKALRAGGTQVMPPTEIQGGMGWIAVVAVPGGPAVGLWSNKK